jgi:ribosomal protein S18 acetylase RimI-like enzyme
MNVIKIEHLSTGAEERLRAIRLRALAEAPDAFASTFEDASKLPFEAWQHQLATMATFVAVARDRDVGIVRGARHTERNDTAYLCSMWVAPEMRGRGIAAALIDSIVAWAMAEGFARLILDVSETNAAAAALYVKKGFVANGIRGTLPPPREHFHEFQMEMKL